MHVMLLSIDVSFITQILADRMCEWSYIYVDNSMKLLRIKRIPHIVVQSDLHIVGLTVSNAKSMSITKCVLWLNF